MSPHCIHHCNSVELAPTIPESAKIYIQIPKGWYIQVLSKLLQRFGFICVIVSLTWNRQESNSNEDNSRQEILCCWLATKMHGCLSQQSIELVSTLLQRDHHSSMNNHVYNMYTYIAILVHRVIMFYICTHFQVNIIQLAYNPRW